MTDMFGAAHPNYKGTCEQGEYILSPAEVKKIGLYKPSNFLIGINGYARSGKDTVAEILVRNYGFKRFSFADHLRACLYELNPVVAYSRGTGGLIRWQDVIKDYGYENYKDTDFGTEMRRLLQVMGTEVGRNMIQDDIWVRELDKQHGRIVVPDMRFPNEYDKIKNAGGIVWRIDRPDVRPVNPHVSETAIDDKHFDYHIENSNTIKALEQEVDHLMDEYGLSGTML